MAQTEVLSYRTLLNLMGQEAGKPTWPKPTGGYQTITGRRYGRRHAYVSFRPSLMNQERYSNQQTEECEGLELDSVLKENLLCSSPHVPVCSPLVDAPLLPNIGSEEPACEADSNHAITIDTSMFSPTCYNLCDHQNVANNENSNDNVESTSEECNNLHGQNGIAFVNIDSYEPDSSDGEEDGFQNAITLAKEETGLFQEKLDNMLSRLEKDMDSFSDLQSHLPSFSHNTISKSFEDLRLVPFRRLSSIESDTVYQNKSLSKISNDETLAKSNLISYDLEQKNSTVEPTIRTHVGICNALSTTSMKVDQENSAELVVRPKVRKQNPVSEIDKKQSVMNEEEEKRSSKMWTDNVDDQPCNAEIISKHSKEKKSNIIFDPKEYELAEKKVKNEPRKHNTSLQEKSKIDDSAFWDEFEDCGINLSNSNKDEDDSSECSDGEWSASLPSYFSVTVKDQSSSDESWETLPGKEEQEPEEQSDSSGVEEEHNDFGFQSREQTSLEDGEIPWLQYHEEIESSSDEENDQASHFVHPGFFMLDGNNNLEDDSSMSEDLDVEWRLLDEFGDGLGVAQAISYVDPQFLTYMALEERLAQAMEVTSMFMEMTYQRLQTALAHLESLAIDVEQAHPPASKESIDCLPQIIITEDHNAVGQEQCCAICCSEYIKEEIVTELPCRHFFHVTCITLWLQKSGTCPVCRHVLPPGLSESAAPIFTFLPEQDSTPSVQSASGTQ
ncbi:E3 ubiquitin-protein ligase Praja-2 isoform X3 [Thamnophis elegans]|uniref:E3 ubiquitin-protein ligase Praja-2 isoform X3 n=1 Tax=Thamnophis elegans TaxID=35005 RepID=UPI0013790881|nr:E3 ubiquitin-protein ligase Praja-2 isoform X3 [Thamnophis elegans]XP_032069563.1 E3 ubiquitin-protein ligase Praja-2 isoform X3 [Thamnophis elegans]XP_032069564.1 E3 ubiquitin-protein ligase Praja-2 isoform X3 [Thamnophis elegans]